MIPAKARRALVALLVASSVFVGVIVAAQAGSTPVATVPNIYAANPKPSEPAQLDASLQGALSAFQHSAVPSDVPPSDIIPSDMKARGANLNEARLAGTFNGEELFLLPANGGLCIASSTFVAMGCYSTADVLGDRVAGMKACYPGLPASVQEFFAILPGATDVTATYDTGEVRTITVNEDVLVLQAKPASESYPRAVSWRDASGSHTMETFMGKLPVPYPCTEASVHPDGQSPQQMIDAMRARIAQGLQ